MKSYSTKTAPTTAADRQARKKKRILIALAGITLLTWSRSVLGGDSEPAAKASANASAIKPTNASESVRPVARAILTYEQASERMKTWPAALERRAIEGSIADLTPAYWVTGAANEEAPQHDPAATQATAPKQPVIFEDTDELPLRLRSTALLGDKRYAVIGNVRYSEGDRIQVPGVGELLVESVRSREAVLRKGQRTWTLIIQNAFVEEGS